MSQPIVGLLALNSEGQKGFVHKGNTEKTYLLNGGKETLIISNKQRTPESITSGIYSVPNLEELSPDDIVLAQEDGSIGVLFRPTWGEMTLFVTNQCNSKCLMCPQGPDWESEVFLHSVNMEVLELCKPGSVKNIAITGGEPTIFLGEVIELLKKIDRFHPSAPVLFLTNGREFQHQSTLSAIVDSCQNDLMFCVPLHSDNDDQHDFISQAPGSFVETMKGIFNLYRLEQWVEIRVVVNKLNFRRLKMISEFIWFNLPFVSHVAFVGLEISGRAVARFSEVWVDPFFYQHEIEQSVDYLWKRGMQASIYNIPLCLVSEKMKPFCRDSISKWKKQYNGECIHCLLQNQCSGTFSTSALQSEHLIPFVTQG